MPTSTPTSQSVTRHILVILAIAVFITAMALIILQNILGGTNAPRILQSYNQGYADGYDAARTSVAALAPASGLDIERPSLSGSVLAVSGDRVQFRTSGFLLDERADGVGMTRVAEVTTQTQITVRTEMSPEEIAAAQAAFINSRRAGPLAANEVPPPPPITYTETPGMLEDIAVGDNIQIAGENGEDLTLRGSFTATTILVSKPYSGVE